MKFRSPVFSNVSGSIGGTTFAHNRGGLYTRNRSIPTNAATPARTLVRTTLATLVNTWIVGLTDAQHAAWAAYAAALSVPNKFGDPTHITGQQMFIRCNSVNVIAGLPIVFDAPALPLNTPLPPLTLAIASSGAHANKLNVGFDNTQPWAQTDGGALVAFLGHAVNPTVNYYKSPFQFVGSILGSAMTPPTSPQYISMPILTLPGQKFFVRFIAVGGDGSISLPQYRDALVV